MSSTDLVFKLLALDEASKVFKEVSASAGETAAAVEASNARMARSAEETAAKQDTAVEQSSGKGLLGVSPALLGVAAAAAAVGAKSIEMASRFESSMTTLQTGAGESAKNMHMVGDGILSMATQTGTSTQQLISGMYMIESAGFHGAQGLDVLHAAAEGAKVGNADLSTVGNALTDVLNDYHLPASAAVSVTNMLVKTVSSGKTTMEELSSSMANVVPLASSAHIQFAQVAGALATMTGHGMSAQQASQDLANTIRSLQSPNAVAVHEMQQLGLNSNQVSQDLGKKGLTGTLAELTSAITSHMGPAGTVLQSAFNNSSAAAANAKTMMGQMPAPLQHLAQALLQGSLSTKQWTADIKGLDPIQKHNMQQFAAVAKQTHEFNNMLTSGGPAAQTYNAALGKMTGGATGLTTSLMLTGENAATFASNVKGIGDAGHHAGKNVQGWAQVTQTLSFKLDQAKEIVETLGIRIGMALMPAVKLLVTGFVDVAKFAESAGSWLDHHKTVVEALGIGIGVVLLPSLWGMVTALWASAAAGIAAALPFAGIILVVSLLALGILELIKHWKSVEKVFVEGFDFVKEHWKIFVAAFLPGIGILIVGIVEIVQHWKQISKFLSDIWRDVVRFFQVYLLDPLEQQWRDWSKWFSDAVLAIKVIFTQFIPEWWREAVQFFTHILITPLQDGWHTLTGWFDTAAGTLKRIFTQDIPGWWQSAVRFFDDKFVSPTQGALRNVENGFTGVFGRISRFVSTAFSGLVGIVRGPIDGVIGLVNDAISALNSVSVSIPSWVPGIGGQSFGVNLPYIPMLAHGGLVMPRPGGATVTVAEAGEPEIVSPLPAMQRAMAAALAAAGGHSLGGVGTGPDAPLHLQLDLRLDGQVIDRVLLRFLRAGGRLQFVSEAVG